MGVLGKGRMHDEPFQGFSRWEIGGLLGFNQWPIVRHMYSCTWHPFQKEGKLRQAFNTTSRPARSTSVRLESQHTMIAQVLMKETLCNLGCTSRNFCYKLHVLVFKLGLQGGHPGWWLVYLVLACSVTTTSYRVPLSNLEALISTFLPCEPSIAQANLACAPEVACRRSTALAVTPRMLDTWEEG